MDPVLELSAASRTTAGILFLALVTVESGGLYLVRIVGGKQAATPFQLGFARAGHAHAGVLLILGLVAQVFTDATTLQGIGALLARSAIPVAAILMPAGFFFSSMGAGRTEPNRLIVLVYLGGLCLAAGLITLGVGLLTASS